jgi:hypothetical protein
MQQILHKVGVDDVSHHHHPRRRTWKKKNCCSLLALLEKDYDDHQGFLILAAGESYNPYTQSPRQHHDHPHHRKHQQEG